MKSCLVALFLLAAPVSATAQGFGTSVDSTSIFTALENWEAAWEVRDPVLAARDYSDDADWTNAFGMRRIGKADIEELLVNVFELPFVMAGRTNYEYHDLRFMTPTIALMRSRALREGQQLPDGTVEDTRRTNHLRVFEKRSGTWYVVSHLIGDERTPGQAR